MMVFSVVRTARSQERELLELYRMWLMKVHAFTILSKGENSDKLWESAEYMLYRWQKQRNPAAIKPFTPETDSLEDAFAEMKDFFEKSDGIGVS